VAKEKQARSISVLLASTGVVLLALCTVAVIRQQDVLAGGLAVLSLGAMVFAALTPRLAGPVEMSLTGFKMELIKLSEVGRLADYSEEEILAAIENKLRAETFNTPIEPLDSGDDQYFHWHASHSRAKWRRREYIRWSDTDDTESIDRDNSVEAEGVGQDYDDDSSVHDRLNLDNLSSAASPEQAKELRASVAELLKQARMLGQTADLDVSIKSIRKALAAVPQDSPEYAEVVQLLAGAVQFRYSISEDQMGDDEIATLLSELESARRHM
jgi:hypothetical protein